MALEDTKPASAEEIDQIIDVDIIPKVDGRPKSHYSDPESPNPKAIHSINSSESGGSSEDSNGKQPLLPSDDSFLSRILKPIPDYPTAAEIQYVWQISDWNATKRLQKVQSPAFECGGCMWRISLFPRSNTEAISVYLEPSQICSEDSNKVSPENLLKDNESNQPADDGKSDASHALTGVPNRDKVPSKGTDWYTCAQFSLSMWNPEHPVAHVSSVASHRFTTREQDWGFSAFITPRELTSRGIIDQNRVNISACVRVIDDSATGMLWHDFINYDSKTSTGYVGLANQGATCYLNSLLQLYYVTGAFRSLVYDIPTHFEEESVANKNVPSTSNSNVDQMGKSVNSELTLKIPLLNKINGVSITDIVSELSNTKASETEAESKKDTAPPKRATAVALAMQRVFAEMQLALAPVSTLELTKSFGWDSSDAFTQHDVQELNRILMDTLELAMRGSPVEKTLNSLFVGAMKLYVKCVNVDYELSRVEPFWDIQLNVRGMANLQELFQNYVEPELLSGDNRYDAGGTHGYQDAKKGVFFQWFPPVLHLQLKRFEYDFMADDLVKIDDLYEYPDEIDLAPFLGDVPDHIKQQNWTYALHGVLVHQGSVSNGHYYAMLKPTNNSDSLYGWYRFDDDKVWKVSPNQVFHENFGAQYLPPNVARSLSRQEQNEYILRRATSAYMLVYYRKESLPTLLPNDPISIPYHVQEQIDFEKKEASDRDRARLEALHYLSVSLVTMKSFAKYTGFDIFPDPALKKLLGRVDFDIESYPYHLKVRKDAKIRDLFGLVSQELGYESEESSHLSLYTIKPRANKTLRPEFLINEEMFDDTVMQFFSKHFRRRGEDMVLFAYEASQDINGTGNLLTVAPGIYDQILFIKYYDSSENEVHGLGYVRVKPNTFLEEIQSTINKKSEKGFELWEEVSSTRIEALDSSLTIEKNELGSGDVIVVCEKGSSDTLRAHFEFLQSRVRVKLSKGQGPLENDHEFIVNSEEENSNQVEMWVSSAWSYEEFAKAAAQQIGISKAENLRFFVIEHNTNEVSDVSDDDELPYAKRYAIPTFVKMNQVFPKSYAVATAQLEYELLSIPLKKYEGMRCITVNWLKTILHLELFDIHIDKNSRVADIITKLIEKAQIPPDLGPGLLAWTSLNFKFKDLAKFDMLLDDIPTDAELCCGYFPTEVTVLESHNMFKNFSKFSGQEISGLIEPPKDYEPVPGYREVFQDERRKLEVHAKLLNFIPVFHFQKSTNYTHGVPFLFPIFPGEKWEETGRRLTVKLGFTSRSAFEKIRIALADDNDKGRYLDLNPNIVLYDEIGRHDLTVSLALDHRDRNPRRGYLHEKGISIG